MTDSATTSAPARKAGDEASAPFGDRTHKLLSDMGDETLRFVASRIQKNLEAQQAVLTCTSLTEFQKVQADFYAQTLEEYRDQTSRMIKIMSTAAPKGLPGMPFLTRRDYDDVPL